MGPIPSLADRTRLHSQADPEQGAMGNPLQALLLQAPFSRAQVYQALLLQAEARGAL